MTATFRVGKDMSKPDLKEYLTKIYQLPVVRITTANFSGKIKQVVDYRGKRHPIKRADYKKAWVQLESVPEANFELFKQWNEPRDELVEASAKDPGIRRMDGP
eukprot:CAMPEP_0118854672 /NCGR_PEP_ID=MMETSP1163-20130328/2795_1 /TAXON_ID=124430 /ORGANISM="Phaeomonas parva, Strain CCMP2877" /LENGTH=102 /DNA_ID=CAMNT_0006787431 /DNA_START=228 /DNA_END=536 /DNA_ORIENTATION=+